jgi:hypothetical protein
MSDPQHSDVDEDLLEFLGGIDEVNDESQQQDFSDFLAHADPDEIVTPAPPPDTPAPKAEKKHE